jgi:Zn-dependent M32 family carboxypeptidase
MHVKHMLTSHMHMCPPLLSPATFTNTNTPPPQHTHTTTTTIHPPQAWVSARKASDFSQFKDYLQQWVDVSLQKAAAIDPSKPAYDVSGEGVQQGCEGSRCSCGSWAIAQGQL